MIVGVRPASVVESGNIGQQALLELFNGLEAAAVQLLFFQILEKALYDSVVIGMAFSGKGLYHSQFIDNPAKVPGSKLRALIRMEHDAFRNTPQHDSIPQSVNGKEAVDFVPNPAGNDLSGIEVENGTNIPEASANLYISKVTDPH